MESLFEQPHTARTKMAQSALKNLRTSHFGRVGALIVGTLLLVTCSAKKQPPAQTASASGNAHSPAAASEKAGAENSDSEPDDYTIVFARHVIFHEQSGVDLKAEWLQGRMYPTHPGVIPSLDDRNSFKVEIEEGKTALSLAQLTNLLSNGALKDSQLKKMHFAVHGPREIEIRGIVHKIVPLPVQVLGEMGTTSDGRISIRIESVKVLKIPFKGVLHAFRLRPSDFLRAGQSDGVQANGDSIFLRTDQLLPAPRKLGRVTDVHFNKDGDLEEDYGSHPTELMPVLPRELDVKRWPNFIRLTGGTITFGKLTMQNSDLLLIDSSPGNWFGFDIGHYREQLVAGDMHMLSNGGLQVWIPDITKIRKLGPA